MTELQQNPVEIIQLLPKLVQAIYSEGILYYSGEILIASEARKNILQHEINLIKEQLANLEKILG